MSTDADRWTTVVRLCSSVGALTCCGRADCTEAAPRCAVRLARVILDMRDADHPDAVAMASRAERVVRAAEDAIASGAITTGLVEAVAIYHRPPAGPGVPPPEHGHHWWRWRGTVACRVCGIVRRADGRNKLCPGPVAILPRGDGT